MTTEAARAAGIRRTIEEDDMAPTETELETAPVDLLILTECWCEPDGTVVWQQSTFIAKGDPIPADLAHLPRLDRATGKPIKG